MQKHAWCEHSNFNLMPIYYDYRARKWVCRVKRFARRAICPFLVIMSNRRWSRSTWMTCSLCVFDLVAFFSLATSRIVTLASPRRMNVMNVPLKFMRLVRNSFQGPHQTRTSSRLVLLFFNTTSLPSNSIFFHTSRITLQIIL